MKMILLPLCAALILLPAIGFAAPGSNDGSYINDEGATVTQAGEVRSVVIEDGDSIAGEILRAGGTHIPGLAHDRHQSMIDIRGAFTAQLIALSNDI